MAAADESKIHNVRIAAAALTVPIVWAIAHSVRTRTWQDFLRYSVYIGVPIMILAWIGFLANRFDKSRSATKFEDEFGAAVFGAPIGGLLLGMLYYAVGSAIKDAYLWSQAPTLSEGGAIAAAVILAAGGGGILFYFRLQLPAVYGLTEIVVGVTVAAQRAADSSNNLNAGLLLVLLTAGVYLVVRGLDNIHRGWTKPPLDPLLQWVIRRYERPRTSDAQIPSGQQTVSAQDR
jgi:hypothetical protein